jgi:GUN4-like
VLENLQCKRYHTFQMRRIILVLGCVISIPLSISLWWITKWYSPAESVDYKVLQSLLKLGNWEEADKETSRIILLKASNHNLFRASVGGVSIEKFQKFPCSDLLILDHLWVESSKGNFGFSVQLAIWQVEPQKIPSDTMIQKLIRFAKDVGWEKDHESQKLTSDRVFNRGYFPSQLWVSQSTPQLSGMNVYKLNALLVRTKECYEK